MTLLQDLKYALRVSLKSPGFTAVAIATVALAIGINSAMFSFLNGTVLNPVPYPEAGRLVRIFERPPNGVFSNVSTLNYLDWAEQCTAFEHVAARSLWLLLLSFRQALCNRFRRPEDPVGKFYIPGR